MKQIYILVLLNIFFISITIQTETFILNESQSNLSLENTPIGNKNRSNGMYQNPSLISNNNSENKRKPQKLYSTDQLEHMEGNISGNEEFGEKIYKNNKFNKIDKTNHTNKMKSDHPSSFEENNNRMSNIANMITRWNNEMGSFGNAEIFTIEIKGKDTRTFLMNINKLPTTFKGAFVISAKGITNSQFSIYSPSGHRIYYSENLKEELFKLAVSEIGQYRISITNNNYFTN